MTAIGAVLLSGLGTAAAMALSSSGPPAPRIVSGPGHRTLRRVAGFRFTDAERGVSFRCSMNGAPFRTCHSPALFVNRPLGRNVFRVQARTPSGATSPWARYAWTVAPLAPGLAVSAPAANRYYNGASWRSGCGACGTLQYPNGRPQARIWIRQLATGRYWNGHGYAARRPVWVRATLSPRRAGQRIWSYPLALPAPDGAYTIHVRAVSRLRIRVGGHRRWVIRQRLERAVSFSVDTVAPAMPAVSGPSSPNNGGRASLRFSDGPGPVVFQCALDGAPATACTTPVTYAGLAAGAHRFLVWATDEAGNQSAPASYAWQQTGNQSVGGQPAPFTISGQAGGPLYPGGLPQPIPLTLSNPNDETIYVTSLAVAVQASRLPSECSADGFQIGEPSLPPAGVVLPARATITLPTLALGAASIQMINTGTNQDACQNAALALTLTGSAHS